MARASRSRREPRRAGTRPPEAVVYVEGPGDRAIVEGWARSVSPRFERAVRASTVILGGRQPARARDHWALQRETRPDVRAICILDRDGDAEQPPRDLDGLSFFLWQRRHIESYLLDPEAIRRAVRRQDHDGRLVRFMREQIPEADDARAFQTLHAKRLLSPRGPIAQQIGRPVPLGRVARAMRNEDFPTDVHALIRELRELLGHAERTPVVTLRPSPEAGRPSDDPDA